MIKYFRELLETLKSIDRSLKILSYTVSEDRDGRKAVSIVQGYR